MRINDPRFLDFEASSLSAESWPVEVGIAWLEGADIRVYGELIRPDQAWPMSAWSEQSAQVHGIPLAELERAEPAVEVARRTADQLAGSFVVSDAPAFEERWLQRLLDLLPNPPQIRIFDFDALVHRAFRDGNAIDWVYETLERTPAPHRASRDARRLAKAWGAGFKAQR